MLLQMSKHEQQLHAQRIESIRNQRAADAKKPKSLRQQIKEYPGRVVSVARAYDRMRSRPGREKGMSLHYACTTPLKISEG